MKIDFDPHMLRPLTAYFLICSGAGCVLGGMYAWFWFHVGLPFWYRVMGAILMLSGILLA